MAYTSQGRDINLDIKRVVGYRHWCNKLWNAIRFAMINLGAEFQPAEALPPTAALPFPCRWILSRLSTTTDAIVRGMEAYEFAAATTVRVPSPPRRPRRTSTASPPSPLQPASHPPRRLAARSPAAPPTQALYEFWQYELCDVFIELMKPVMALDDGAEGAAAAKDATRNTLWICLEAGLR